MKTIKIKGRDYVMIHERIKYFRENDAFKGWQLTSEIVNLTDTRVVMKAEITSDLGLVIATGHAYEDKGSTQITDTSFIEVCETSAWGRALANLGIGIEESLASAEEVATALKQQKDLPWMDHLEFTKLVNAMNKEERKEDREFLYLESLKKRKVKNEYKNQLLEIVNQRDINV
jgi:hypothetical protein